MNDRELLDLAALREELVSAKRDAHNSEVALKAAYEKQGELRAELADSDEELDTVIHHNIDLQQRLADQSKLLHMAKELLSTITMHRAMSPADWCDSFKKEVADRIEKIGAFLNTSPESKP